MSFQFSLIPMFFLFCLFKSKSDSGPSAHTDEAEAWIRKAIETDEQHKMPWDLARDYALYAEFFQKKADPAQSKEKLDKAIDLMRSINADGWVKKYEEELATIS